MYTSSDSLPLRTHIVIVRLMLCIFFLSIGVAFSLSAQTFQLFEAVPANAQTASVRLQNASRRAEQAFSQYSLLTIRPDAFQQLLARKHDNLSLALPIPGQTVNVSLQPYNPFTPNATFTAKTSSGEESITLDKDFALYRGTVNGDKFSQVNMSVSGGKVLMTVRSGGKTLTIESVPTGDETAQQDASDNDGVYALYSSDNLKEPRTFSCDAPDAETDHDHANETRQQSSKNGAQLQHALRLEAEIAIVIDYATYQALGSSQAQATQYAGAVIAAVSQIYERDINTQLRVSHVQVWTTPDPYAGLTSTGSILSSMANIWNTTQGSITRDLAHLLSSRLLGGGIAYLNALCSRGIGYGVSGNLRASFPIDPGWTTIVVAHELGHNFGSPHTHSCSWPGGPLDRCAIQSGETCIPAVVRSRGTIMSYCHTLAGGISNIDVMFHPQCATLMRTRAEAASCLTVPGVVTPTATITSFSPTSGGQGTSVVISGTNFTGVSAVRFGGVSAQSFVVNSPTQVTAVVASGASGLVQVVAATNTAISAGQFSFTVPPASITSFSPTSAGQGISVIITGSGFANVTAVRFGNTNAAFYTVNSPTQITAVVGAGASGAVQVITAQNTATSAQNFTFIAPQPSASISSFSPLSGTRGTTVVITGSNFTNVSAVRFGGVAAQSFSVNSTTRITAIVGAGASGTVQVATLTNTAFSAQAFTYSGNGGNNGNGGQQLAAISSFSPASGNAGTAVLITGSGFNLASAVRFGGVNAIYFTVLDDTRITAIVGQGGASGTIQVITPTNTATSLQSFTLTGTNGGGGTNGGNGGNGGQQLAVITSVSPLRGGRGTSVIILGTNFQNATGVRFGGTDAQSFTINSPTQITAITGVGSSGAVEVITPTNTPAFSQMFTFPSGVQPSTSSLSFPALRINSSFTMNLSLQNTSTSGFTLRSLAISGADASDFTIVSNSHVVGTTLGGGEIQTIAIRYRPTAARNRSATIRLVYDGQTEPIEVSLSGAVDTSALLSLNPSSLTLPSALVGEASAPVKYEIQGWGLTSSIGLVLSGDIQVALSSTGTWQSRLEIPVPNRQDTAVFRATVWVRSTPRQDGIIEGRITYWSGNAVAVLPVTGFTQRAFISHEPELPLGTIPFGQSTVASYFLRVTNIEAPLVVTTATGVMISTGMNGPWQNSLTLLPIDRIVAATIFVRYEANTLGTFTSRITHSVGGTSSSILVRANVVQPIVIFRTSQQMVQGIINFGYVPQRLSSTATYWVEATNGATPITLTASSGFTIALADNNSWSDSLTITPQNGRLRQIVYVRFQPRWEGIFSGAITHRMNGTTATLRLLGSSLKPTLTVSASRIDFGTIISSQPTTTSPVRSYQLLADGVTSSIQVRIPQGAEASLSKHGPWQQNLTLTPIAAQAHATIFVRTTSAVIGQEYRAEIVHSASENDLSIGSRVLLTANLPQNSPNASESTAGAGVFSGASPIQSYPNPFTEETTLVWNQIESGAVRVVVSSASGIIVRTLTLSNVSLGEQRIVWDGRDESGQTLASGVYSAQVQMEGQNFGKRIMMMLVR